MRAGLFAAIALLSAGPALADGRCDLNTLVGYQLLFARPIAGYVEGGMRKKGYEGCEPDRVLVFADNSGVRCKQSVRQTAILPTAIFSPAATGDLKLCVEGELFDVRKPTEETTMARWPDGKF